MKIYESIQSNLKESDENTAKKLLNKVTKAMDDNEYDLVKINGVNCSYSDLETLEMLLNNYIKNGNFSGFMILGEVREVLEKNNLL